MLIVETKLFQIQRDVVVEYVAKDKKNAAIRFVKELKKQVNNLTNFPYKCRVSYYHNDENTRDMIFKGCTIIYRVSQEQQRIEILEIFNKNMPVNNNEA
ncbi:type II toxin-antitoxin system RelE/ParE family toxin [Sulfurimonas sp.]|uniref:type II toxin-antitoxin system RelE/ParE family toxin n=1 Tax=Sulfurimonas sp. TaxID=2022749 RepID=UPI00261D70B1|nr:type II toxin-antitoxin system RelE/ParE family toxin [Sulfurimonas sp.]